MEQGTGNAGPGFRQIKAWQKADELASAVFRLSSLVPDRHRWFSIQLLRAAVSVPANIAEGHGRGTLPEYVRFLEIATGSLNEVEYYLHFARNNGLVETQEVEPVESLRSDAGRLLFRLTQSLRTRAKGGASWQRGLMRDEQVEYDYAGAGES